MLGDGEIREAVKNPVPASKSVNRIAEDIPLSPLSRAGAHQERRSVAAGGCGGGLRLRHGGPGRWAGLDRELARPGRGLAGASVVGGEFPARTFRNF